MLWDGDKAIAEWSFGGRSSGWLCLIGFENHAIECADDLKGLEYPMLRRLYRFIVQCGHDFRSEAIHREVEYQAAFNLFANACEGECHTRAEEQAMLVACGG
jgi:hypothetical protein